MITRVIATTQRNPFPSFSFSSSLVVKRNLLALNVCIGRLLHFHGIYILELKKLSKNYPFSRQKTIIDTSVSKSFTFVFAARRTRSFLVPKKNREKWGNFEENMECATGTQITAK